MTHYDIFNGDADGICALHQLRLAQPLDTVLVTGVKRDIALLERVAAQAGDSLTVLDVSMDRNRAALQRLLGQGVTVEYFDHHFSGPIPMHAGLVAHIDPAPGVCTSTLVDRHLQGRHRPWAIVGAFGDNLDSTARALAHGCGLDEREVELLRELGQSINYNGYGDSEAELLVPPAQLYRAIQPFASPVDFIARHAAARLLGQARRQDMALARETAPLWTGPAGSITALPDAPWARRVQGELANELAADRPAQAHAVLCAMPSGYCVSVRAPVARPRGADQLCRAFAMGGGRAAAAGIDVLPPERLSDFIRAFAAAFDTGSAAPAR